MSPRSSSKSARAGATARAAAQHWLIKSEPEAFSFADLEAAPERATFWDGVRNYQARNLMRDGMRVGDLVLYYHSNAAPPAVVGVAEVSAPASPDPTQFDPRSDHHDPGSDPAAPRWLGVEVRAVAPMPRAVPIEALKANPKLAAMAVVQRGQRLSVQPVTRAEFDEVLRMGGLKRASLRIGHNGT